MNYPLTESALVAQIIFTKESERLLRERAETKMIERRSYLKGRSDGLRFAARRLELLKRQLERLEAIHGNG